MQISSTLHPKLHGFISAFWQKKDSYSYLTLLWSTRLTFCKDGKNCSQHLLNQYSCIDYSSKINWNTERDGDQEQVLVLHFHHWGKAEHGVSFYHKDRKFYTDNCNWAYWIKYMKLVGVEIKRKKIQISLACIVLITCLAWTSRGSGVNNWQLIWFSNKR